MLLESCIGNARALTRLGDRRLWLLDEYAAILWDLHKSGLDAAEQSEILASRFGESARTHMHQLHDAWAEAGLLANWPQGGDNEHPAPLAIFAEARPVSAGIEDWCVSVAGCSVMLSIESRALRKRFRDLIQSPVSGSAEAAQFVIDHMAVCGDDTVWTLKLNGQEVASGNGEGDAMLAAVATLTELGCRTTERLMVLHGAGLIGPQGQCLLLAAPGGSGKTTLAMALEAEGFRLLSDDVVPISQDGMAHGLGLPACIKQGSWPVLSVHRPDLASMPAVSRFGQAVRYLPPHGTPFTGAARPSLLLFPRYKPDAELETRPLPPENALQRIVEADAVIRDLTQEKFERLCGWVEGLAAHELTYPNLGSGIALVHQLLDA